MDVLAQRFEDSRPHLAAVAYRMLGSRAEADDAVQEAWLRLAAPTSAAWTTCGDGSRPSCPGCAWTCCARGPRAGRSRSRTTNARRAGAGPEGEAVLADSVGAALLVVLDTLAPAERLAFVLHDLFAVPFDEIGTVLGRSPAAAGSWPAVRGDGSRARERTSRTRTRSHRVASRPTTAAARMTRRRIRRGGGGRSSPRSSPPRAAATSPRSWRCSTPTPSSWPTPPPSIAGAEAEVRGAAAVAATFVGPRQGRPASPSSTASPAWSGRTAARCGWRSRSPWSTGASRTSN